MVSLQSVPNFFLDPFSVADAFYEFSMFELSCGHDSFNVGSERTRNKKCPDTSF